MSALQVTRAEVSDFLPGARAAVLQDDVNGSSLVIQQGRSRIEMKLKDLMAFLDQQAEAKDAKKPD